MENITETERHWLERQRIKEILGISRSRVRRMSRSEFNNQIKKNAIAYLFDTDTDTVFDALSLTTLKQLVRFKIKKEAL